MKQFRSITLGILSVAVASTLGSSAEAGIFRRSCAPPSCGVRVSTACCNVGGHYENQIVERTIMVPQTTTEVRTITVTVMKPEQRQRTFTVRKEVPYTETMTQEYTVMVQKTEMRQVTHTVCRPVVEQVEQAYTVMVPHQESRTGVRHVTVCQPETVASTVCVDRGCWVTREVQVPCGVVRRCGPCRGFGRCGPSACNACGGCGTCAPQFTTQCIRTWVPNLVHEQVTRTVMRSHVVAQPYEYSVTVCKPETHTRTVNVTKMVSEQVTKEVPYTVCVPEKRTRNVEVTKCRVVEEPRTVTETVMVPVQVEKTINVNVCTMVPKTVQQCIRVWVPNSACGGCSTCGNTACGGCSTGYAPAAAVHAVEPSSAVAPAPTPAAPKPAKSGSVKQTGTAL